MSGYKIVNLLDMVEELGEESVKKRFLSDFSCPLNADIEQFLKEKAIEFAKQGLAGTHLIFTSYKDKLVLCAYFTIAIKFLTVEKKALSSKLKGRINKFAIHEPNLKKYVLPAPLIGQLGKNFTNGYDSLITGDELLKLACDEVKKVQRIGGGKLVYLECENKSCLIEFYKRNGFVAFGERKLDKDEQDSQTGESLIQMLRYFEKNSPEDF